MKRYRLPKSRTATNISLGVFVLLIISGVIVQQVIQQQQETRSHASTAASWQFQPSGFNGSGFQNVVVYSPFKDANGNRPVIVGADVAGIHRSLDGGKNWMPSDRGLGSSQVATLMFSTVTPGKVYAGTDGGIFVSTDFGQTWSKRAGQVNFDANGNYFVDGHSEHPRPTGNLFAQDNSGSTKYFWAATATQGLKRSTDDGNSWDNIAFAGQHLRSVALDPNNPDVLYVAVAHGGVYKSTNARGAMTFTLIPGSPDIPEELYFVGGTLYLAAHNSGIFKYNGSGWTSLNNGIATGSGQAAWESITGYVDGSGNTVLFVGCTNPHGNMVMESTDGGASWRSLGSGAGFTVSSNEYGQTTRWWAADSSYLRFGGGSSVAAYIVVDPDDPTSLLVAGRGGIWHGQLSSSGVTWAPAVHNLMVTVNMMAVADPKIPGRVYIANMDYTLVGSKDNGKTFADIKPVGAPSTGDYVALDSSTPAGQPSVVYLAASKRGQDTGIAGLWSNPDPFGATSSWTSENIPVANDVLAFGVGHQADGTRVILASITNNGLWRKQGTTWSQVTGTAPFAHGGYGTFAWRTGTPVVFAVDSSGVWRSDQAGISGSWVKLMNASASFQNVNEIVNDPTTNSRVYVTANALGGVYRIDNADTATPQPVKILPLANPGPLAMSPSGALFANADGPAQIYYFSNPAATTPTATVITSTFYADNIKGLRSLAVGPDNYVYTAAHGVAVGIPSSVPPTVTPSPTSVGACSGLVISTPLALDKTTYAPGATMHGSISYTNPCSVPYTVNSIVIAVRDPNGTNDDFPTTYFGGVTVQPGQVITLSPSRFLPATGPVGQWRAYGSYQQTDGTWRSGPSVTFTVTTGNPTPTPTPGGNCTVTSKLVNPCRPWLGAAVPGGTKAGFLNHEQRLGHQLDVVHTYHKSGENALNADELYFVNRPNTILMTTWKPAGKWIDASGSNATVNASIDHMADSIKAVAPHKVMLSIHHEPENDVTNDPACPSLHFIGHAGTPADYKAMWQNVRNHFDSKGVTNVVWVWNAMGYPNWFCIDKDLYPGNNLVDWIVWDPYNFGSATETWVHRTSVMYNWFTQNNDATHDYLSKPWGFGEWGITSTTQQVAYNYYDGAKAAILANQFPRIKLFTVFDIGGARVDYASDGTQDPVEQQHYNGVANAILGTNNPTTPTPTVPNPTPTPRTGDTLLGLTLALQGIGNGGDNANPQAQGNMNPLHPQRTVTVDLYNAQNNLVKSVNCTVNYNQSTGLFTGTVNFGNIVSTGDYVVKVRTDRFLRDTVPGIQHIVSGQTTQLPKATLVNGDANNDNIINIEDYNMLTGCFSDLLPATNCPAGDEVKTDFTDDGAVNSFDYNLFLRELMNLHGQ